VWSVYAGYRQTDQHETFRFRYFTLNGESKTKGERWGGGGGQISNFDHICVVLWFRNFDLRGRIWTRDCDTVSDASVL